MVTSTGSEALVLDRAVLSVPAMKRLALVALTAVGVAMGTAMLGWYGAGAVASLI